MARPAPVDGPAPSRDEKAAANLRRTVFDILDEGADTSGAIAVRYFLVAMVLVSVAAGVLESVPAYAAELGQLFVAIEALAVVVFTLEYLARVWSAPENRGAEAHADWQMRLRWMARPQAIVDLVSVAPVYLALLSPIDLKSLLVLRLFRFFKLARYSPGMASLVEAVYAERRALMATGIILLGTVLVAATAMHYAEKEAQPDKLGTIPDAMYWAFVTLATVGYGDIVPITPLGKIIATLTAVIGILMLALPVGILASAFADEIRRRDFVVTWTMLAKVPLFAGLGGPELAGIMRTLRARSCERGEAIVRRGEPARSMFFVTAGEVEVELEKPVRLRPGDFFGEMGLLHGAERSATVSAVSRVRLLELEAHELNYLMDHTPGMAEQIRRVAAARRMGQGDPGGSKRERG